MFSRHERLSVSKMNANCPRSQTRPNGKRMKRTSSSPPVCVPGNDKDKLSLEQLGFKNRQQVVVSQVRGAAWDSCAKVLEHAEHHLLSINDAVGMKVLIHDMSV